MRNQFTAVVLVPLLLLTVPFLKGCATADVLGSTALKYILAPDPTIVQLRVRVASDVNPDARGRPSPVKMRFYLLESVSVFKNADFFQLKGQDRELLKEDIRLREERVFKPGDERQVELSLPAEEMPKDDKLYLGVVAGYWDLDQSEWQAVQEVELEETTEIVVEVARSGVSLQTEE